MINPDGIDPDTFRSTISRHESVREAYMRTRFGSDLYEHLLIAAEISSEMMDGLNTEQVRAYIDASLSDEGLLDNLGQAGRLLDTATVQFNERVARQFGLIGSYSLSFAFYTPESGGLKLEAGELVDRTVLYARRLENDDVEVTKRRLMLIHDASLPPEKSVEKMTLPLDILPEDIETLQEAIGRLGVIDEQLG